MTTPPSGGMGIGRGGLLKEEILDRLKRCLLHLAFLGMVPSFPPHHCHSLTLLPSSCPQVSLGLPQPPTAPVLHPRGPNPRQVSGAPPGGAAARGAGDAVGAAAPGRCFYWRRAGLAARKDAPGWAAGLPFRRCLGQAVYPLLLHRIPADSLWWRRCCWHPPGGGQGWNAGEGLQ